MADLFAKMSVSLDHNRKIRKAGRNGRDVFLWVLRRVGASGTAGFVSADDIDDLEYMADELMCDVTDARDGRDKAIAAGLLKRDGASIYVVGWEDSWGRRAPMSEAERQRKRRDRAKSQTCDDVTAERDVTNERDSHEASRSVTDERDVTERRGEEKRREETDRGARDARTSGSRKSEPTVAELADVTRVLAHLNALTGSKYTVDTHKPRLLARLREGYSADDLEAVARYCAIKLGWKTDAKMSRFLRPATLYGPDKIRDYIDEARQHASRSMHVVRVQAELPQPPLAAVQTDWYAPPDPIGGFHSEEPS